MCNDTLPVKTCNNYNIRIGPGEVKVLHGIVRKTGKMDTAVTEHIDSSLSGDLTIYPRVVSLKSPGTTVRTVKVCNLSTHVIEIPPKSLLCSLTGVDVADSWTPDPPRVKEQNSMQSQKDLGIQIDKDNLSS